MTRPRQSVLPALAAALLAAGCGSGREPTETLRAGVDVEFPPFCYRENGKLVGFDVELADEACRRLGWKFEPVPLVREESGQAMANEKVDCIWTAFTRTDDGSLYAWCDCYCEDEIVVLVRADSDIVDIRQLAGRIAVVQAGTAAYGAINPGGPCEKLGASFKKCILASGGAEAINLLQNRECDALVVDKSLVDADIARSRTVLAVLPEPVLRERHSVAFPPGRRDRRDALNRTLSEMAADGPTRKISGKYFGGANAIALKTIGGGR